MSELMLLLFLCRHHQWLCALLSIPWQQKEQMQGVPAACLIVLYLLKPSEMFYSAAEIYETALRVAASCELF